MHRPRASTTRPSRAEAILIVRAVRTSRTALPRRTPSRLANGITSVLIMCDGEGNLGDIDEKKRNEAVENHKKWVEAAKFLGCHSIRVNSHGEGSAEEVAKAATEGLRSLSTFAKDFNIGVIVENHGGYSSDGQWLTSVIKATESTNCGTLPDFGNFRVSRDEEYDRYKGVTEMMPYAKAVSAKTHDFDEQGNETHTDYRKMTKIVLDAGYHSFFGIEYEGELKFDQKNQILNLRISLLRDPHTDAKEPIGIAVYVRDLTRAKEYEKLKSDMISLMSHELRTPLTSINGFAELLTMEDGIPVSAREFVTIIANESQRMSRMINTFLAVTQLERKDKQEVLKIPLRLDEVVRETISAMQPFAKKKRIRLIEQPASRIPPVAADKSLITQAVKNLVNNAIRYSPERTTVTVSTALEAEAVRVCVEDRGFGIPAEAKERVWDKFYRVVREGQEKDEESTGLGLSFVREVVEQHGGQVELHSEEGRGSKFSFTLPRL